MVCLLGVEVGFAISIVNSDEFLSLDLGNPGGILSLICPVGDMLRAEVRQRLLPEV